MTDTDRQAILVGVLVAVAVFYAYAQTDEGEETVSEIRETVTDAANSVELFLRSQLQREEGRRNTAYLDTRGIWTIGIGHTGPEVRKGLVWTDAQVDAAFDKDVQAKSGEVNSALPWITGLAPARQVALYQMAFQMGTAGLLKFVNTLAAVREGRWSDAARGMRASLWARQTPKRALRLAQQMETGEYVS